MAAVADTLPSQQTSEVVLKPSKLIGALRRCLEANKPVVTWGSVGVGKSEISHQLSVTEQMQYLDIRAVLFDAVDFRGIPYIKDGQTKWALPDFLPTSGKYLINLEELNRAPVLVQNSLLQLVLNRKLGDYTLPPDCRIISACNPESEGGGVQPMTPALKNRFTHLHLAPDLDDWCQWAVRSGIHPMVVAGLRWKSDIFHSFDRKALAFPTPRAWATVSDFCQQNGDDDIDLALIAGTVGYGAAIEFMAFRQLYQRLPNLDNILLNPTTALVPNDVATRYAVSSALSRKTTEGNFRRILQYLERLPVEFNVACVRDAVTRVPSLQTTEAFTTWSIHHSGVLN